MALVVVVVGGCESVGRDPIQLLALLIGVAAALAFWFQLLKDW